MIYLILLLILIPTAVFGQTSTTTVNIDNAALNIANGLFLFLFVFFGLILIFKRK